MKTLTIVSAGLGRPDRIELLKKEQSDKLPRISLYERTLESDMLDESFLGKAPLWRRALYRLLPKNLSQVVEAFFIRKRYDVIITWAERLGYPFAFLLKITGSSTPHITLNSWITGRKKEMLLKMVHSHIDRILLWSSVQRDYAISVLNVPPLKITFIRKFADQQFWRPVDRVTDMICAAGMEMRDYTTLIEAMRGLDIRCHIAAGKTRGKMTATVQVIHDLGSLPSNVTVEPKGYYELRELYARSRFVVIPLLPTDTDNGLTCMLESMAMGKTVICSRTRGQVDIIREGETGIYVPQGDPVALRKAILDLWNDPEKAKRMGEAARRFIEEYHTIEQFVESVKNVALEVVASRRRNHS